MENFLPDLLLSAGLVAVGLTVALGAAKAQGLPYSPVIIVTPVFIVVGLLLHHPLSPGLVVLPDAQSYLFRATDIFNTWRGAAPEIERGPWPNKDFWPLIKASMMLVAGPVQIAPIVFNSMVLALAAGALQWATYELTGTKDRYLIAAIFISSSPILLFGSALLREAIFWLGAALGLLSVVLALNRKYPAGFLTLISGVALVLAVRPNFGMAMSFAFVATFVIAAGIYASPRKPWKIVASTLALTLLVISAPQALEFVREDFDVRAVQTITDVLGDESVTTAFTPPPWSSQATEATFCDLSVLTKIACNAAANFGRILFGPFWWEVGPEPIWLIAIASTLHFQALLGLSVVFLLASSKRRFPPLVLGTLAIFSLAVFSALLTNYGIMIRFRAMTEILLIPTAIGGWLVAAEYFARNPRQGRARQDRW